MLEIKCANKPSLTTSEVLQRNARVKTEARLRKDGKQYTSVKPVKRQLTQRLRVQRLPRTNKPCLSHLQVPIYILSASHHFRDLKPNPNLNTCEYCDSKPLPHFKTSEYTVDYGAREAGCGPTTFLMTLILTITYTNAISLTFTPKSIFCIIRTNYMFKRTKTNDVRRSPLLKILDLGLLSFV
jgi:hypothetical protein